MIEKKVLQDKYSTWKFKKKYILRRKKMAKVFLQIINAKYFAEKYFTNIWHIMFYKILLYTSAPLTAL